MNKMEKESTKADMNQLKNFLRLVDKTLKHAYKIHQLGAGCSLHFNLERWWEIPETLKDIVTTEIQKRDSGTPEISWYNGHLTYVTITNPYG